MIKYRPYDEIDFQLQSIPTVRLVEALKGRGSITEINATNTTDDFLLQTLDEKSLKEYRKYIRRELYHLVSHELDNNDVGIIKGLGMSRNLRLHNNTLTIEVLTGKT